MCKELGSECSEMKGQRALRNTLDRDDIKFVSEALETQKTQNFDNRAIQIEYIQNLGQWSFVLGHQARIVGHESRCRLLGHKGGLEN